jgi:hypothetical protein
VLTNFIPFRWSDFVMRFLRHNGVWKNGADHKLPTFPVQDNRIDRDVPLAVAEEAYKEYSAQFGASQSLARLGERGGFGSSELAILLFERIKRLEGI